MYSVIDLFAGAGGLSLGFQQTNKFTIKVAFENSPYMQETYRKNHPGVEVLGDVCDANYSEIVKKHGPIDVVIGGPPCQGYSNAKTGRGNRAGNILIMAGVLVLCAVCPEYLNIFACASGMMAIKITSIVDVLIPGKE